MGEQRDPRVNPQPGDRTAHTFQLRSGAHRYEYNITGRTGRLVLYDVTHDGETEPCDTYIEDWVAGSTDDEVLHVAENFTHAERFDVLAAHRPDCRADELVYEIDNLVSMARDHGRLEVAALLRKALAQAIKEGEDGRG